MLDGSIQCLSPQTITSCRHDESISLECPAGQRIVVSKVQYGRADADNGSQCLLNSLPYRDTRYCPDPRITEAENVIIGKY